MTKIAFTSSQKDALDLASGKLVVAGAGSGKTTVLAERYLRLLESGLEPPRIVAMTFTRKAAASLRAKIYDLIQDRLVEQPEHAMLWREHRDAMRDARISTIHSFCADVLRAYPDSAGVDPEVAIGPKASIIQRDQVREHIRSLAYRRDETLRKLLGVFPKQRQASVEVLCLLVLRNPELYRAIRQSEQQPGAAERYLNDTARAIVNQFNGQDSLKNKRLDHHQFLQALTWVRSIVDPLLPEDGSARPALSFDDIEHAALALLCGNSAASKHLRGTINALLVDEFQDTSLLQWRLVRELVRDDRGEIDASKLFLVGDEKQSIYSFRNANVTVVRHATDVLCVPDKQMRTVELSENFRTQKPLLETLNPILERLLNISKFRDTAFVAKPQPMVAGRQSDDSGHFDTTLILDGSSADYMNYIAKQIKKNTEQHYRLEESGKKQRIENSDIDSPVNEICAYNDIAILLKSRTHLPELELALQLAKIPYTVNSGKGFFTRQEVLDLVNLVQAFANPNDMLTRVAVLRGPIFNLPDTSVAALYMDRKPSEDPWQSWLNSGDDPELFAMLEPEDHVVLQHARLLWQELQQSAGLMDPVEWLRLALDRSGAWAAYAVGRRGRQALANIEQFLEMMREYRRELGPDLRTLIDRIHVEMDREDGEMDSEADVSGGQGVQIMTIHSAKGLEFPFVILALPDSPQKRDHRLTRGNLVAGEGEFHALTEPRLYDLAKNSLADKDKTNLHTLMYAVSSQEEELAELLRLLYVAATRARDRLLVVANASRRQTKEKPLHIDPGKKSLSDLWLQACDVDLDKLLELCGEHPGEAVGDVPVDDALKTSTAMRFYFTEAIEQVADTKRQLSSPLPLDPPEPGLNAAPDVQLAIPQRSVRLHLPLEAFAAWVANPSKENLDSLLHLSVDDDGAKTADAGWNAPDEASSDTEDSWKTTPSSASGLTARLSGTILHAIVQRFGPGTRWENVADWVERDINSTIDDDRTQGETLRRVQRLVESASSREWGGAVQGLREYPVALQLGSVILRGRIDLAWCENGKAVALDLKTNDVPITEIDELVRKRGYDHQAKLYALAYRGSLGCDNAEGRLLFLPVCVEKYYPLIEQDRQYYMQRASELLNIAEDNHLSAYTQTSMKPAD